MRVSLYVGPKEQIAPTHLPDYERSGKWIAEEKRDGCWSLAQTDERGIIYSIISRTGVNFPSEATEGILGLDTKIPNSQFVGELETATQAATKLFKKLGYRRFWVFDSPRLLSNDTTHLPYESRRELIEITVGKINSNKILLVNKQTKNFQKFFDAVLSDGGEGLVLKKYGSIYKAANSDGKTDNWIRAKKINTIDFYVMRTGKTPSKIDNLELGVWNNGCIKYVQSIAVPKGYLAVQLVGKVIECEGDVVMDSGALRHARFLRIRDDKTAESSG